MLPEQGDHTEHRCAVQRFDNDTKLELTLNVESINIGDYVIQKAESKACTDVQLISFFFFVMALHASCDYNDS